MSSKETIDITNKLSFQLERAGHPTKVCKDLKPIKLRDSMETKAWFLKPMKPKNKEDLNNKIKHSMS